MNAQIFVALVVISKNLVVILKKERKMYSGDSKKICFLVVIPKYCCVFKDDSQKKLLSGVDSQKAYI